MRKNTATAADLNIMEWTMDKTARLTDATHSGCAGWALYKPTLTEASGTVKAHWDSAAPPDGTLALDAGAEVNLSMYEGTSGKFHSVDVVIEKLTHRCNNQTGLVEYDFSWKSQGAVTDPV